MRCWLAAVSGAFRELIRRRDGVLSMRAGFSRGDVPNAPRRNHGTHAEAIEVRFDPSTRSQTRLIAGTVSSTCGRGQL